MIDRLFFFAAALCITTAIYAQSDNSNLTAQVKQGILRGTKDHGTYVWRGVRYAQPPVGALRFRAPQPLPEGKDVIDATKFGNIEAQAKTPLRGKGHPSEDCLFLNIWRPTTPSPKKPVMLWIHGGGFTMGSGSDRLYDGSTLARNGDIIVVTCNYRLGPFGFLDLAVLDNDSTKFDSNLGLRDQMAALKWVKENISAFGGDPDNITIAGESAGGTSVLALLAAPNARRLFQKAIVESGSSMAVSPKDSLASITREYLKVLGVAADNIAKLYTLPADAFLKATQQLAKAKNWKLSDFRLFRPVIGDNFLPMDIDQGLKVGGGKNKPMLIGTNRDECNLFAILKGNKPTPESTTLFLSKHGFPDSSGVTKLYTGYPSRDAMLAILTDGMFRMPSIHSAEAQYNFGNTYMYRFDWSSATLRTFGLGACHGLELPFVFGTFSSKLGSMTMFGANRKKAKQLSKNIQSSWIKFIKTGDPSTAVYAWPAYDIQQRKTLIIDNQPQVIPDPDAIRRKAWDVVH